ncbi:LiaI-LiaF-like domain-containing protein [Labilibacter marinus]|uniref:LiaI-LiaF-like domain-containing protein n=1 Tax=Labilibacter marinus TaxID=1477105 RepID=UPI000834C44B|nr:DUF5668 domain-containing protein [Labilibacter marinus]
MEKIFNKGKASLGLILLIVGGFLLLGNLGLIPHEIYHTFFRWPSILIVVGIFQIIRKDFGSGLIVISVGTFFLLPHVVNGFHFRDIFMYWPALLIIAGVVFIFGKKGGEASSNWFSSSSKEDVVDVVSIFGGGVTKIESDDFKGGEITCIFGGAEINLQNAQISPEGAVIELTTIFGGSKLTVPRDWSVRVEVVSIFGGFADKRIYESEPGENTKTLVIKGAAIFGGGELRNF